MENGGGNGDGRPATLLPGLPAAWDAFADVKRFWSRPAKPPAE